MSEEHQIATDDEKRDDLSSPVAESRELAMLREVYTSIKPIEEAAMSAIKGKQPPERAAAVRHQIRISKAAFHLCEAINYFEQAMVSRDGQD